MKIIYNPEDGALIHDFIYLGDVIEHHYQAGATTQDGTISNGLKQYEDDIAEALLSTFGFLTEVSEEGAKKIIDTPPTEFKCNFPGCDFVSSKKIGLIGHQRGHQKEAKSKKSLETPVVDVNLIPVAKSKKVESVFGPSKTENEVDDIKNGSDKDGVEWYGEGTTVKNESNKNFGPHRGSGQAHFKG
jgi:hypothetical protein